jgi:uncharacterized protein (TIGR03437 family)
LILSAVGGAAYAQAPSVLTGGVVNVASYQPVALPGSAIAQGSMFVAFGSNLGPATLVQASSFPLQTTLGGTSVKVTSGSVTAQCPIFYVASGQFVAILPSNVPTGTAQLTVTTAAGTSSPVSFQVATSAFGIFTGNGGGSGPGAITDVNGKVYGFTNAANPNETAVIYGTGLGPVSGNEAAGPLPGNMPSVPLEIWVGGVKANISYQGRSGCCVAMDQISFMVPNVTGCRVPVTAKIGTNVSNFATIAVAPAGSRTCSDPGSPSSSDLAKYLQNGVSVGVVGLTRVASSLTVSGFTVNSSADAGSATFIKYSPDVLNRAQNPFNSFAVGSCVVSWSAGGSASGVDPTLPKFLDAGAQITVSGSAGSKTMTKNSANGVISYAGVFGTSTSGIPGLPGGGGGSAGFLDSGTFSITGPGGPDVGAFTTSLSIGTQLTWSNMANISAVTRANGAQIFWTGGDPNGYTLIGGFSSTGSGASSYSASFSCYAKTSDGNFIIPSFVTLAMPVSATVSGAPLGALYVGAVSAPKTFTATGIDYGIAVNTYEGLKTLAYQ